MNNLEHIKILDIDKIILLFIEFLQYKCMCCKYHYDKGDCFDKDCEEGIKEWLLQKADNNFWNNLDVYFERVKEIKKGGKK